MHRRPTSTNARHGDVVYIRVQYAMENKCMHMILQVKLFVLSLGNRIHFPQTLFRYISIEYCEQLKLNTNIGSNMFGFYAFATVVVSLVLLFSITQLRDILRLNKVTRQALSSRLLASIVRSKTPLSRLIDVQCVHTKCSVVFRNANMWHNVEYIMRKRISLNVCVCVCICGYVNEMIWNCAYTFRMLWRIK